MLQARHLSTQKKEGVRAAIVFLYACLSFGFSLNFWLHLPFHSVLPSSLVLVQITAFPASAGEHHPQRNGHGNEERVSFAEENSSNPSLHCVRIQRAFSLFRPFSHGFRWKETEGI